MLCLNAGKNVLCEKSMTVNAAQTKILIDTARAKRLFLMEAVWTRFFPLAVEVRQLVKEGKVGVVERVVSDFSMGGGTGDVSKDFKDDHRALNLDLAGGALLDCKTPSILFLPFHKGSSHSLTNAEFAGQWVSTA
jgi:predicted dehydrogenase